MSSTQFFDVEDDNLHSMQKVQELKKNYKFSSLAQSQWKKNQNTPPPAPRETVILIPGWSLFRDALQVFERCLHGWGCLNAKPWFG